jgi:hypothetical protein
VEKNSEIKVGGSVDGAVKGHFTIDVKNILQEAWKITLLSRISINLGLLFIFILAMVVSFIASDFLGGFEVVMQDPQAAMILNVLVTLLIWPFMAGIEMMGVLHSVGFKTQPKLIFSFFKRASWVAICALLTSLFISIGIQLFILPGIFLAVALSLAVPLVVEKQLSPIQAIILSIKALRFQWFKIFAIYMSLISALVVALLPLVALAGSSFGIVGGVVFFFALSYLAPWYYNVKGILYREIFGLKFEKVEGSNLPPNSGASDTFSA